MSEILSCRNISLEDRGRWIVKDASISLKRGEIHVLVGDNGAGKSMLMNCIAGMVPYQGGEIWLEEERLGPCSLLEAQRQGIYMVSHRSSLLPNLSVMENMYMTRWKKRGAGLIDWKAQREEARLTLARYGLELEVDTLVGKLGMAQQRIVEIIKMLTRKAKVLILDESFTELTDHEINWILDILQGIKARGHSFFWVTQRYGRILECADSLSLMHGGRVVMTVNGDDLTPVLKSMEQLQPIRYPRMHTVSREVLFEARGISDQYVLSDISFQVHKGEILGITGMMGSGRTCLAKLISGANRPNTGEMYLRGERLSLASTAEAYRREIAYFPEDNDRSLVQEFAVAQNITLGNIKSVSSRGLIDLRLEHRIGEDYGKRLGSAHWGFARHARELSKGMMQKVIWARNLLSRAKLLVLDEPTKNLDNASKVEVYNIINSFAQKGNAVVMLSSDYHELIAMCDRLLVLRGGTIVKELTGEEISVHNIIEYAK